MAYTTKEELRTRAKAWRSKLAHHDVMSASREVSEQLESLVDWSKIKSLHAYLPIAKNNEIDTFTFLHWLWSEHPNTKTYTGLKPIEFNADTKLTADKNSIPTPKSKKPSAIESFDVILVPCLISDNQGFRLGYGQGNYDRFLSRTAGKTIGLCYKHLVHKDLPTEVHDVALDQIILSKTL